VGWTAATTKPRSTDVIGEWSVILKNTDDGDWDVM
jgi:hypothetical protein